MSYTSPKGRGCAPSCARRLPLPQCPRTAAACRRRPWHQRAAGAARSPASVATATAPCASSATSPGFVANEILTKGRADLDLTKHKNNSTKQAEQPAGADSGWWSAAARCRSLTPAGGSHRILSPPLPRYVSRVRGARRLHRGMDGGTPREGGPGGGTCF